MNAATSRTYSRSPVEAIAFGDLRRLTPVSRQFGFDRGTCIDRYYIEKFLTAKRPSIRGRVLEVADDNYTCRFGGDRVTRTDILHVDSSNRKATIVGDLTRMDTMPKAAFDCIILTQTLPFIYEFQSALTTLHGMLKQGGSLLATFPGISQVSRYDMDRWGDYWRFTDLSARRTFGDVFGQQSVNVTVFGNVLAATGLLHGLSAEEFSTDELNFADRDYQVIIAVQAVRRGRY